MDIGHGRSLQKHLVTLYGKDLFSTLQKLGKQKNAKYRFWIKVTFLKSWRIGTWWKVKKKKRTLQSLDTSEAQLLSEPKSNILD